MAIKIIPDLTILEQGVGSSTTQPITEQGVGPAIDVWPDSAAGSGGSSGGNEVIVPTISALATLTGIDGSEAYVLSVESPWQYVESGAQFVIDHITVEETPAGGATRWVRDDNYSSPIWRTSISDVYIDPVGGNDENQGIYTTTPGSPAPLKTAQELSRRWGSNAGLRTITSPIGIYETIIHILNPISLGNALGDRLDMSWVLGPDTFFRILGENTVVLFASTITTFTLWNPSGAGGGSPNILTDVTVATWAPYIGMRVYFPSVVAWAYILKDLGGGSARISVPQFADEPAFLPTPVNTFPSNGDVYQIEDPVHVCFGETNVHNAEDPNAVNGSVTNINLSNITVDTDPTSNAFSIIASSADVYITFYQCIINGFYTNTANAQAISFSNCRLWALNQTSIALESSGGLAVAGGALIWPGGPSSYNDVSGSLGDQGVIDYDTTIQSGCLIIRGGAQVRTFSVWDATVFADNTNGDAVLIGTPGHHSTSGAVSFIDRGGSYVFGNGSVGVGVGVGAACSVIYETLPNVVGVSGQFRLGSGGKARYFDETTGVPSAIIAETWANLNTAQPAGFGGYAHDYTNDSSIMLAI